ncbi:meckelin isoform X2 [Parasteatoda tepidariorum]|uniref:meckelin isoform X2 n=1 Tax=Parasteatoda tepidariorum TaxID=114398 RepID=UPI001C71AA53|nr:meckelin isoform X2 [Parasteatoda tepidariorum]
MSCFVFTAVLLLFSITLINGNFPVPAVYPEFCNSTEYFDSICIRCKKCGKDDSQVSLQTRAREGYCTCRSQFYVKNKRNSVDLNCSSCPPQTVPAKNKNRCLKCMESNPFNETTGHCEPCMNGTFVETDEYMLCISCENSPLGIKDSDESIDICSSQLSITPKLCSESNLIGESVKSALFKEHLNSALYLCKENEDFACQMLANFCVLLLYKLSIENNACLEFRKIARKRLDECPSKQLWLYYFDEEARWNATKDLYQNNVPNMFSPSLNLEESKLQIVAKQFALNGSFIGIKKLKSDDLHLCQESDLEDDIALTVGTQLKRACTRSLQSLWLSSHLQFYDLYLVSKINQSEWWYPIPVLIRGILVNGEFVNIDKDPSKWLLVRRYFLTDHISGIEEGLESNQPPTTKVFRYAADVSLRVIFKPHGNPGTIYPPLLTIAYAEATPDDFKKNKKVTVKFSVSYEMDQSSVMKSIVISMSIFGVLSFAWSVLQTFSWYRRSGKNAIDLVTLGKFTIFMCGNLSTSFFCVIFLHCFYWLTFFKKQDVLHSLLPIPSQEKFLSVYIGLALTMKAIQVIHLLFVQCSINIFFVDWERPRVRSSCVSVRSATTTKGVAETNVSSENIKGCLPKTTPDKMHTDMAGISIWRTYYVANEWTEIQSKRKINLCAQLFGVLFFLKVLDFESYALASLKFNLPPSEVHKYVPYSACSRLALGASVFLSLALLQVVFRKGIYERFVEDKLQQYVDLCSVSNVSVFLLLTKKFGYYIHGRSTHGKADVNMKEMHEFLRKEEEDLCGYRGLLPDTQQQTFQFVLPPGVHDQFIRLLLPLTSYSQAADRMQGVGGRLAKVDISRVANTHYMLNKFLSAFIDHSFKDIDYVVKDRVLLEYLFDIECFEVADRGYFYNDDGRSFSNVMFYGNESILLLFDVLLFTAIDIASTDFVLSAILTFLIAKVLQGLRRSAGRRNLVRKALIDERFLT